MPKRAWPVVVAGTAGLVSSAALLAGNLAALILSNLGPPPGIGWIKADAVVNVVLAFTALGALIAGLTMAKARTPAIVTGWLVVVAGLALAVVSGRLS